MHEYSIVEQVVAQILDHLKKEHIDKVTSITLQRGSTFAEDPLRMAFEMTTEGTALDGCELIVTEFVEECTCANCHFTQTVSADDLIGHMIICPECGMAKQIDEASGLKVIEILA
jgi:hydrogenase nickel insertion protein HypA